MALGRDYFWRIWLPPRSVIHPWPDEACAPVQQLIRDLQRTVYRFDAVDRLADLLADGDVERAALRVTVLLLPPRPQSAKPI